jgi:hypothetical protein
MKESGDVIAFFMVIGVIVFGFLMMLILLLIILIIFGIFVYNLIY